MCPGLKSETTGPSRSKASILRRGVGSASRIRCGPSAASGPPLQEVALAPPGDLAALDPQAFVQALFEQ